MGSAYPSATTVARNCGAICIPAAVCVCAYPSLYCRNAQGRAVARGRLGDLRSYIYVNGPCTIACA